MDELPAPWIQTPPAGWLGFLGIKSGGRQPGHTGSDMFPMFEMRDFYAAGGRTTLFAASAANNNNVAVFVAGSTVPQGKVWLVERICAQSGVLGVAAGVKGTLTIDIGGGAGAANFAFGPTSNAGATGELVLLCYDHPVILMPGQRIGILGSAAAAPTAFNWLVSAHGMEVLA